MSVTGETADQLTRMTLQGIQFAAGLSAKAGGKTLKSLSVFLYSVIAEQKKVKGKTNLKSFLKSEEELKIFAIHRKDLHSFYKEAKRYGVLYHVIMKEKGEDGICDIMIKAKDANKVARIANRLEIGTLDTKAINSMIEKEQATVDKQVPMMNETEHNDTIRALMEKAMKQDPKKDRMDTTKDLSGHSLKVSTNVSEKPSVRKELSDIKQKQQNQQKQQQIQRAKHIKKNRRKQYANNRRSIAR